MGWILEASSSSRGFTADLLILQLISCVWKAASSSRRYVGHLIRFYVIHASPVTGVTRLDYLPKQWCEESRAAYLMRVSSRIKQTAKSLLLFIFSLDFFFFFFLFLNIRHIKESLMFIFKENWQTWLKLLFFFCLYGWKMLYLTVSNMMR